MVKRVLITGPTSGIGHELARCFAENEFELILVSRSEKKLQTLAKELKDDYNVKSIIVIADLTKRTSPKKVFKTVTDKELTVDILVNNAGYGSYGQFRDLDLDNEVDMIDLNVTSLVEMTGLFLPHIIKRKGKILNVASTAAFQPIPLMATYAATKAFVLSFTEALTNELSDTSVTVTALCPGPTRTNFDKAAHMEKTGLFKGPGVMDADAVARKAYDALMEGRGVVVTGVANRAGTILSQVLPGSSSASIAKKVMKRMK